MNATDSPLFSSKSDEYSTPQWLFDQLNAEFHFHCDAAATEHNTKCKYHFEDALAHKWYGFDFLRAIYPKTFWLNPPYSQIGAFMKKAYEESQKGATVVCLIPSRTDTKYWHEYVMKAQELRFVKGRLKFGDSKAGAPFPSVVVIFDKARCNEFTAYPMIGKTIERATKCVI